MDLEFTHAAGNYTCNPGPARFLGRRPQNTHPGPSCRKQHLPPTRHPHHLGDAIDVLSFLKEANLHFQYTSVCNAKKRDTVPFAPPCRNRNVMGIVNLFRELHHSRHCNLDNVARHAKLHLEAEWRVRRHVLPQGSNFIILAHVGVQRVKERTSLSTTCRGTWKPFNVLLRTSMYTLTCRRPYVLMTHALEPMMVMILLHIKASNPTLLRERSRTADQCKQTVRENGPRLRRKCLNSELSYGQLTSRERELRRCRLVTAHFDRTANQISSLRGVQAGS